MIKFLDIVIECARFTAITGIVIILFILWIVIVPLLLILTPIYYVVLRKPNLKGAILLITSLPRGIFFALIMSGDVPRASLQERLERKALEKKERIEEERVRKIRETYTNSDSERFLQKANIYFFGTPDTLFKKYESLRGHDIESLPLNTQEEIKSLSKSIYSTIRIISDADNNMDTIKEFISSEIRKANSYPGYRNNSMRKYDAKYLTLSSGENLGIVMEHNINQ